MQKSSQETFVPNDRNLNLKYIWNWNGILVSQGKELIVNLCMQFSVNPVLISVPDFDTFNVLLALSSLSWWAMELPQSKILPQCERKFVGEGRKWQYYGWIVSMRWECSQHFRSSGITCVTAWPLVLALSLVQFLSPHPNHILLRDVDICWVLSDPLVKNIMEMLSVFKKLRKSHLKEEQYPKYACLMWIFCLLTFPFSEQFLTFASAFWLWLF